MANSFQGGTFDPIRQADYVPALEQNIKLQEREWIATMHSS